MVSKHNQSIDELESNRQALRPVKLPVNKLIAPDAKYDKDELF